MIKRWRTERWRFCVMGFVGGMGFLLAIALHGGVPLEQPGIPAAPIDAAPIDSPSLSTAHSPSSLISSSGLVAPLTWSSSPHAQPTTLQPGVATHAFALARIAQTQTLTLAVLTPPFQDTSQDTSQSRGVAQWQPTARYLTDTVPGYAFSIVGMDADALRMAIAQNAVDFIVSESGFYAEVESEYNVNRLATRRTIINDASYTVFGSIIFSLKERDDIQTLADLKHQRFVSTNEDSLEGWQIAWRELADHNIDPYTDLEALRFVDTEIAVVAAVLAGDADAGVIRADTMEQFLHDGIVRQTDFTVLNRTQRSNFPLPISTRLYPEWPFAALNHVPERVAQQVAIALLSVDPTSEAARSLNIAGWSMPLTYQPVHTLFKQLRIGPYRLHSVTETLNIKAVLWHYKRWIFTIGVLLLLGTTTIYVQRREITRRKQSETELHRSQAELTQRKAELEQTLATLQNTQAQLIQTEKMSSLGQLMAGIAHEINNPVNFIHGNINYANQYVKEVLTLLAAYQNAYPEPTPAIADLADAIDVEFVADDLPKLLKSMQVGSERIREIVQSLRIFSRLDEAELKAVDIHTGIDSTLMILQSRLKPKPDRPAIQVMTTYGSLPPVECNAGQLNQVFMNILSNAIDALEEHCHSSASQGGTNGRGAMDSHRADTGTTDRWNDRPEASAAEEPDAYSAPTIWITTERLDMGLEPDSKTEWVRIGLKNNGPAIPYDVQQKLFNPFFTTKPIGKGTGLGMSISYQIVVEKHRGRLRCVSNPDDGVEFIIEIPVHGTPSTAPLAKQSVKPSASASQPVQV